MGQSLRWKWLVLLCLCGLVEIHGTETKPRPPPDEGDRSCRCLSPFDIPPVTYEQLDPVLQANHGPNLNYATYGFGCAQHDADTITPCRGCGENCPTYCTRYWCWVDDNTCELRRESNILYPMTRTYSYATCRQIDELTSTALVQSLNGMSLRVGFTQNRGLGWTGVYSTNEDQFDGPIEAWSGPTVDFAIRAAQEANVTMELVEPPSFLQDRMEFFLQKANATEFDLCVYATTLGFLDFCVGQYAITPERASVAEFYTLQHKEIHLLGMTNPDAYRKVKRKSRVLEPFRPMTWWFMILFVVPTFSVLFVFHEYNQGSHEFAPTEPVLMRSPRQDSLVMTHREVPIDRHIIWTFYKGLLMLFEKGFSMNVSTIGGQLNLMGFAFFAWFILSIYTAQLAAVLFQQVRVGPIANIDDVINGGFRVCAERTTMQKVQKIYAIPDSRFVVDPVSEGGDGQPGYACPKCQERIFDFLDPGKSDRGNGDPDYCDVALGFEEALQIEQAHDRHLDKGKLTQHPVATLQIGFPLYIGVSAALRSLFIQQANGGVFLDRLRSTRQRLGLQRLELVRDTGFSPFRIGDLLAIWCISGGFAVCGLVITVILDCCGKDGSRRTMFRVTRFDQHGNRVSKVTHDLDWVWSNKESLVIEEPSEEGGDYVVKEKPIEAPPPRRRSKSTRIRRRLPRFSFQSNRPELPEDEMLDSDDVVPGQGFNVLDCNEQALVNHLLENRFYDNREAMASFLRGCLDRLGCNESTTSNSTGSTSHQLEAVDNDGATGIGDREIAQLIETFEDEDTGLDMKLLSMSPHGTFRCKVSQNVLTMQDEDLEVLEVPLLSLESVVVFPNPHDWGKQKTRDMVLVTLQQEISFRSLLYREICFQLPDEESEEGWWLEIWSALNSSTCAVVQIQNPVRALQGDQSWEGQSHLVGCQHNDFEGFLFLSNDGLLFYEPPVFVPQSEVLSLALKTDQRGEAYMRLIRNDGVSLEFTHFHTKDKTMLKTFIDAILHSQRRKSVRSQVEDIGLPSSPPPPPPGLQPPQPPVRQPPQPPLLQPPQPPGLQHHQPPGLQPRQPPGIQPPQPPGLQPSQPPGLQPERLKPASGRRKRSRSAPKGKESRKPDVVGDVQAPPENQQMSLSNSLSDSLRRLGRTLYERIDQKQPPSKKPKKKSKKKSKNTRSKSRAKKETVDVFKDEVIV